VSEPTTKAIEDEVARVIREMGENVVVKKRFMPPEPDRCVLVTARARYKPVDRSGDAIRTFALQVRVRDPKLAIDLADKIDVHLTLYPWAAHPSPIDSLTWESTGDIGRDANDRDEIAYNYEVIANVTRIH